MANPYLGFRTYKESDSELFKGREEDIRNIYDYISNNNVTVLYANSGIGKSSVINAGLCPLLRSNNYFPLYIRCNDYSSADNFDKLIIDILSSPTKLSRLWNDSVDNPLLLGNSIDENNSAQKQSPDDNNADCIRAAALFNIRSIYHNQPQSSMFYQLDKELSEKSLWWFLRTREIYFEVMPGVEAIYAPLLIFDQFEEFFDKASSFEVSGKFFSWYNSVFSQITPSAVQKTYNEISRKYPQGHKFIPDFDLKCKSLFSLRKEYIGQLDYWVYQNAETRNTDFLYNRYLLRPLQRTQAEQVINLSNKLQNKKEDILQYIGNNEHDGYPAILLSVICDELLEGDNALEVLKEGDVEDILSLAYERAINCTSLTPKEIEDVEIKLVDKNGKRIRRSTSDLLYFLNTVNKIEELLDCHILTTIGEGYYEFIHDKIAEVVASKNIHVKNRKKNAQRIKNEMNVLSITGRLLIDNANDFGGFRTINNRKVQKIPQLELFYYLSAVVNMFSGKFFQSLPLEVHSTGSLLDGDVSSEIFSFIRFANENGNDVMTRDGIYQFKVRYKGHKLGNRIEKRIDEVYFYGHKSEQKLYARGGFHGIRIKYSQESEDGSYTETREFLDDLGNIAETIDGYAIAKYHFNQFGLLDEVRYFDKNEQSCNHADGNHGFVSYYDEDGFEIKRIFVTLRKNGKITSTINVQERLSPTEILSGVCGHIYERDNIGRIITEKNIDRSGNICYDLDGYCTVKYRYDTKNRIIEESYYDHKGTLVKCKDGFALIEIIYNDETNTCEENYYLDSKKECIAEHNDGYWRAHFVMDSNNRLQSFCYRDKNNCPIANNYGIYKTSINLNEKGQVLSICHYDVKGKQIEGSWADYNKQGTRIIRIGNLSASGEKERIPEYDCMALGFVEKQNGDIFLIFLNERNRPQKCAANNPLQGIYGVKIDYDDQGRPIADKYYDASGKRVASELNGLWGTNISYNDVDKIRTTIFQKKGGIPYNLSFSKRVDTLNELGELLRSDFYNVNGEKAIGPDGTYSFRTIFSQDQSVKTIEFLDENDNPMDNNYGYAFDIEERIRINSVWKPLRIVRKNAKNEIVPNGEGDVITKYLYYKNGEVVENVSMDEDEKPCTNKMGFSIIRTTTNPKKGIRLVKTEYLDINRQLCDSKKGYSVVQREYDEFERVVFEMKYDVNECPIENANGTYGVRIIYGEKSKTTIFLDKKYKWMISKDGYAKLVQEYDEKGRIARIEYYDTDNHRIHNKLGEFETIYTRFEYDLGRETTICSIGEDGKPHLNKDGWAFRTTVYDKEDYETSVKTYDENKYPICSVFNEAYGYEISYSDNYKKYEIKYLLPNGKLGKGPNGFAVIIVEKDDKGRIIKECYLDTNEQPYEMVDGTYEMSIKYLDNDTRIVTKYKYDIIRNLYYIEKIFKDEQGRITKELRYDLDGNPFEDERTNCGYEYQYDGEWTRLTGLDENFKPHYNEAGYCMKSYTVDDKDRVLTELFFDEKGNPQTTILGVYGFSNIYDDEQKKRVVICLDKDGSPVMSRNGYAAEVRTLDDQNRVIEEMWLDEKLHPVANELGDYGNGTKYHNDGGRTITSLDADKKPRMNSRGYSKEYILEDERKRTVKRILYDINGIPVLDNLGGYGISYIYGQEDNDITYISLDFNGNPRMNSKGWASKRVITDSKGRKILELFFDAGQNPVMDDFGDYGTKVEYDDNENKRIIISLDENTQPHLNKKGYAKKIVFKDEKDRIIKERTLDVENNPVPDQWGDCGTDYIYDDENNSETMISLDENEKPRINIKGWAYETKVFDEKRRVIKRFQFDAEYNLVPDSNGDCGEVFEFDDENKTHSVSRIGIDGNVRVNSWGMAIKRCTENADNRPIKIEYLDEQGDPVHDESGNYGVAYGYLDDPQIRIMICLDKNGETHECIQGYAYRYERLNDNDDIIRYYLFDINREPLATHECRITYCKDDNHTIIRTYYGINGEECNNERGYFKEISFNDAQGNRKEFYFDTDGNIVTPNE